MKSDILEILKTEVDKQTNLVKQLVKQVEDLTRRNTQLEERCLKIENEMATMPASIYEELNDRERRKKNLIISGVPESVDGSAEERKLADANQVKGIFEKLPIGGDVILRTYRIGKVSEGRNRLLKVICVDADSKVEILQNAKLLRDFTAFENIYINPDLTLMQRNERKRVRDEFKRRRALGENVVLRYGRIVSTDESNFH